MNRPYIKVVVRLARLDHGEDVRQILLGHDEQNSYYYY